MTPANVLGYMMQHVAAVMCKQADQLLQDKLAIRLSQLRILMMLQQSSELQQNQIADGLGQTEASISRQIQVLYDKSLLTAERDPVNKRKRIIRITSFGNAVTESCYEVLSANFGPLYANLGPGVSERFLQDLLALHQQVCQPGNAGACDHHLKATLAGHGAGPEKVL